MVLPWLWPLALVPLLALLPATAPWSEGVLTPLLALGSGAYLLSRREGRAFGLGLLLLGLGDAARTLEGAGSLPRGLLYPMGYAALTLALLRLPGKPPRLTLALLPLALLGGLAALRPGAGVDRLLYLWDALLLLLLLPRLETLFQEGFAPGRALLGSGLLLLVFADMGSAYVAAQAGYPAGHPAHLLRSLGYLFLALGEERNLPAFLPQALALGGVFLLPVAFLQGPAPWEVRFLAVYGGLTGALGLLFASHREGQWALARGQRWTRFLEALARLSPRITQTLSPEGVLLEALEAARALLPEAVGLEVRSRRGLVGERSPHALALPLDEDAAHLYLKAPPQEEVPPGFLALLGERIRQVLKQVEWGTLAFTDPLTGLLNRRGLEAELPKLLALARRYQAPVSVVMLDIDHFKRVNDTYGHPVGDEVLKRLGRILRAGVRQEDLAVRYGGDEFLLLLFGADRQAAKEVVERVRDRFRAERVGPIPHPLTLSGGVAGGEVPGDAAQMEEWVLRADYALLRAKEAGRDRVTLA